VIRYRCDRCGTMLDADGADRYIVTIEAYAAAGPLDFTDEDLRKDCSEQIRKLIGELEKSDVDAVEDQVYRRFRFDLCGGCHRHLLDHPLPA